MYSNVLGRLLRDFISSLVDCEALSNLTGHREPGQALDIKRMQVAVDNAAIINIYSVA